jgi:iron complex transport system substrate-binding protein
MNHQQDVIVWNTASLHIVDVKHGLLIRRQATELFENSVFLYVHGKSGRVQIEDAPYQLKSNGLFHVCRNKRIVIDPLDGEVEYFAVAYQAEFPPSAGRNMLATLMEHSPFEMCFSGRMAKPAFFAAQFSAMADVWRQPSPLNQLLLKRIFYAIIHEFYQELLTDRAREAQPDVFEKAKQHLQNHFSQPNSIQLLADTLGVKRATLHRQFKRNMGLSPQQYIMQLRLDFACAALADGSMSIDEIAASSGLRDKSYFSRVFKQKYGVSPGAYRKSLPDDKGQKKQGKPASVLVSFDHKEKSYTLIENFGRIHRYYGIPRRIVCLDYSAAELCAALGAAHRLVGVASAESALIDCAERYQKEISEAPFLPGRSPELNVPALRAVSACRPDLVIGSAYSFHGQWGVAEAEAFERLGIHIYALKATYTLGSTFQDTYEDINNLGRILGADGQASALIANMKQQEERLLSGVDEHRHPVRVFSFDSILADKVFTCGQSLESHMIHAAGGINIFDDRARQFVPVDWMEVAKANPEAIIVHRFHDQSDSEQKIAFLKRVAEIAHVDAIRNHQFYVLGVKKVFPGIDNLETALSLAAWFHSINPDR